ncbi:Ferredoxin-2 (modular protein) [Desulfamplus magnetovallimortis]|uniref:Ferredoxin-2 (Modular protein) n=1 Tax=Desulfamplus magnetovallimortis TaxID=1246637 RepID=A0A1W1HCS2_9BACT|nr:ferredoxin [Desulfamplus magnetovallimortis]SLM30202.1 Ferredoxin-2 (modular protein) [Desulfamplus magnetovallimortis]
MIPIENIPGKYYVNSRCVGCDICLEIAPDIFACNHDEGYAYVGLQPDCEAEENLCMEAMHLCPVNAIEVRE